MSNYPRLIFRIEDRPANWRNLTACILMDALIAFVLLIALLSQVGCSMLRPVVCPPVQIRTVECGDKNCVVTYTENCQDKTQVVQK